MLKRIFAWMLLLSSLPRAGLADGYSTREGRYARAFDLNLGALSSLPAGSERAQSRLGARMGLSYEFDPLPMPAAAFRLPLNVALLYSTKAVRMRRDLWTFSAAHLQILIHHPVHRRFPWVEPACFVSPHYTLDMIASTPTSGNLSGRESLQRRWSFDAGGALLIDFRMVQGRIFYARNLVPQVAASPLTVSAAGFDLLLPLEKKRSP